MGGGGGGGGGGGRTLQPRRGERPLAKAINIGKWHYLVTKNRYHIYFNPYVHTILVVNEAFMNE